MLWVRSRIRFVIRMVSGSLSRLLRPLLPLPLPTLVVLPTVTVAARTLAPQVLLVAARTAMVAVPPRIQPVLLAVLRAALPARATGLTARNQTPVLVTTAPSRPTVLPLAMTIAATRFTRTASGLTATRTVVGLRADTADRHLILATTNHQNNQQKAGQLWLL